MQRNRDHLRWSLRVAGVLASLALCASSQVARADQFFATQVIARTVGTAQQTGFTNPNLALGAPKGGGAAQQSFDVYNLGVGGSLTLGFDDANPSSHRYITDGPGP